MLTDESLDSIPRLFGENIVILDRQTVGLILQALTGHNYLNYLNQSNSSLCRFCEEEHEEFPPLVLKCPALARERLDSFHDLQLQSQPPNLAGIIRFIKVDHIVKALDWRGEQASSPSGLTTTGCLTH